jgi:PST family polysaccharide transporter
MVSLPDSQLDTQHLDRNLKARAVSGMLVTVSTQGAKFVLQVLYIAAMARLLSSSDFGLVAMVTSVAAVLTVVRDGGLTTATIQQATVSQEQVSGMFWVNAVLGVGLAVLAAGSGHLLTWFFADARVADLMLLYSVTFVLSGLMAQPDAIIRRQMRFKALGAIEVATLLASSAAGIASAWAGLGYWSLAIAVVAGSAANCLLLWLACGWRPGPPGWPPGLGDMLRFGGHVMSYNLVSALGMNLDKILLGRVYGTESLGFYNRAQALLVQPLMQVLAPLGAVAIPTLSRLHTEPERFRATVLRLLMLVGFGSAFASAFLFAGADQVVGVLLGEGWGETAVILRAFAITIFTLPISVVATWALTTAGLGKELSAWGIVNNGILLAAVVCGLPWGGFGVAMAYSLSGMFLRVPLLYIFLGRRTGIGVRPMLGVIGPAFLVFAVSGAFLLGLATTLLQGSHPLVALGALAAGASAAAATTLVAIPWGREVWANLRSLAAELPHLRRSQAGSAS